MEYFESNVDVIRSQVKANRTYKEISNLYKQNFLEVRRGFSERNLRLFCSKHEITKMNETEVDAIIQDCVSEVSFLHFICREINNMFVETIFFFNSRSDQLLDVK